MSTATSKQIHYNDLVAPEIELNAVPPLAQRSLH